VFISACQFFFSQVADKQNLATRAGHFIIVGNNGLEFQICLKPGSSFCTRPVGGLFVVPGKVLSAARVAVA
jgi:hypothetical protein